MIREQEEGVQVTACEGRERSLKEGAAGGRRNHCGLGKGVQLHRGSSRREHRSLWVEGGGAASRREQHDGVQVKGGRCSFKEGTAGGSRGHCWSREGVQLQGGSSRKEYRSLQVEGGMQLQGGSSKREQSSLLVKGWGCSFMEGAARGSRGDCWSREGAQLEGGSSRREQKSLQVEGQTQLQGGSSRREQRSLWVEGKGVASWREKQEKSLQVKGRGSASRREQQEGAQVTLGRGRGCSFKEGAACGSTGH